MTRRYEEMNSERYLNWIGGILGQTKYLTIVGKRLLFAVVSHVDCQRLESIRLPVLG